MTRQVCRHLGLEGLWPARLADILGWKACDLPGLQTFWAGRPNLQTFWARRPVICQVCRHFGLEGLWPTRFADVLGWKARFADISGWKGCSLFAGEFVALILADAFEWPTDFFGIQSQRGSTIASELRISALCTHSTCMLISTSCQPC